MIKKRTGNPVGNAKENSKNKVSQLFFVRFFYILAKEINSNVYHTKQPDFREIVAIYGCYIQVMRHFNETLYQ